MTYDVERLPWQPEKLYRNVKCDGCGAALAPVTPPLGDGAWLSLQPDDALEVRLVGGYGMAIDPIDESVDDLTLLFCQACLPRLCEQWPAFGRILMEGCSSTLGHHCSKERAFVWRDYSGCCSPVCRVQGCAVTSLSGEREVPGDRYSRPMGKCENGHKQACGWAWEYK